MSEWIEWNGGEYPVVHSVKVDAIEMSGVKIIDCPAEDIDWSKDCDSNRNYPIVKYRLHKPDPNKEWIKIEDGCLMPKVGEKVCVFTGDQQKIVPWFKDSDTPHPDGGAVHYCGRVTHWRYPHPDPVEE